jgi:hypothetical protein
MHSRIFDSFVARKEQVTEYLTEHGDKYNSSQVMGGEHKTVSVEEQNEFQRPSEFNPIEYKEVPLYVHRCVIEYKELPSDVHRWLACDHLDTEPIPLNPMIPNEALSCPPPSQHSDPPAHDACQANTSIPFIGHHGVDGLCSLLAPRYGSARMAQQMSVRSTDFGLSPEELDLDIDPLDAYGTDFVEI